MAAPRKRTAAKTAAKEGKDQAVSAAETVLEAAESGKTEAKNCLLYTSPSPRDCS